MFCFLQNRTTTLKGNLQSCDLSFMLKKLKNFSHDEYSTSDDDGMSVPPMACAFGKTFQNGNMLSMVDEDGYIVIYDTNKTGAPAVQTTWQAHTNAIFDVSWAENDKQMLTASGDQTIALWEVESNRMIDAFKGHTSSVKSVSIRFGDEAVFASGSRDGHIMVWDKRIFHKGGVVPPVDTIYNAHFHQPNDTPGKARRKKVLPKDGQQSVTGVLFQDDNYLVSCGAVDGCIKLWDIRKTHKVFVAGTTPTPVQVYHYPGSSLRKRGFSSLSFDQTRSRLFASCTDDIIYEYNMKSTEDLPVHGFRGHKNSTFYVKTAISPDNQFLLSGSSDNNAYIWQINKKEAPPLQLQSHVAEVTSVAWCPVDLTKLVTLSDDAKTKFWRIYCREQHSSNLPIFIGRARRLSKERSTSMVGSPPPFTKELKQSFDTPSPKQSPFSNKSQSTSSTLTPKSLHQWLKRKSDLEHVKGPTGCKIVCRNSDSSLTADSSSRKRLHESSNEGTEVSEQSLNGTQCDHNTDSNVPSKKAKINSENTDPSAIETPDTPKSGKKGEDAKRSSPRKLFKRSRESQDSPTKSPKRPCLTPVKDNGQHCEAMDRSSVKVSLFSDMESDKNKPSVEMTDSSDFKGKDSHPEPVKTLNNRMREESDCSNSSSQPSQESLTPLKQKLHQCLSVDCDDHDSPTRNLPNLVMDQMTNLRPTSPSTPFRTKKLDWLTRLKNNKNKSSGNECNNEKAALPVSPSGISKPSPKVSKSANMRKIHSYFKVQNGN